MRFMMIVKADKNYEAGAPPPPELMAAVGKLSEEMIKAGVLLDTGGLLPTSKGALINVKKGKLTVTDGPFSEAKEVIGLRHPPVQVEGGGDRARQTFHATAR